MTNKRVIVENISIFKDVEFTNLVWEQLTKYSYYTTIEFRYKNFFLVSEIFLYKQNDIYNYQLKYRVNDLSNISICGSCDCSDCDILEKILKISRKKAKKILNNYIKKGYFNLTSSIDFYDEIYPQKINLYNSVLI